MIVQELINKLNSLPNKDEEILCYDLWEGLYSNIVDVCFDFEDGKPIITTE